MDQQYLMMPNDSVLKHASITVKLWGVRTDEKLNPQSPQKVLNGMFLGEPSPVDEIDVMPTQQQNELECLPKGPSLP
jgi:hypothetical protein